jgi:hypothetical protein
MSVCDGPPTVRPFVATLFVPAIVCLRQAIIFEFVCMEDGTHFDIFKILCLCQSIMVCTCE